MTVIAGTPRITAVVINKYIKKLSEPIMVNARLLGVLKAKGRISFGHDSPDIRWRVRFARNEPSTSTGYPINVNFDMPNRIKTAVLPWRSYVLGEAIPKIEKLIGRSDDTALPRLMESTIKWMMDDFQFYFQRALYADGEAGTNELHGLESLFSYSGLLPGGYVGAPNGTYAGISEALGGIGGTWTGVWPSGSGDVAYCAWSPLMPDYPNAEFTPSGVSTATWATNWRSAVRFGYSWLNAIQGISPDVFVMHPELERQAKDSMDPYNTLEVTTKSPIVDLGIRTLQFEGVEMLSDPFCPSGAAYLLSTQKMELMSMQNQLVEVHKDTDPYATDTFMLDFFGNLRVESPAFCAKFVDIS